MARFVIFGLHYAPEPAGNAPYTTEYAEALAGEGHEVVVVTGYPHYPSWTAAARRWRWRRERRHGVELLRVPHTVPSSPSALGRLSIEATYGLAALPPLATIGHFDVAMGVMPSLSGGLAARLAGGLRRRPVGLLVQDLVSAAASQGGVPGGRGVATAVGLVERRIVRGAHVAAVARGFAEPLSAMGAATVTYLPNFTTLPENGFRSVAETRAQLGIARDAFVVGYSGNLGYKQDFDTVIEAAEVLKHDSSIVFVIVGEGSQQALIDRGIAEGRMNGVRLPLQSADRVLDTLRSFDLLLAPQRATDTDMSVPSKLTAYFAAGRPVLAAASLHSETATQVMASGGGVVVAPGSAVELANAIRALRSEPSHLELLGAASQRYARSEFHPETALARFTDWADYLLGMAKRTVAPSA